MMEEFDIGDLVLIIHREFVGSVFEVISVKYSGVSLLNNEIHVSNNMLRKVLL